MAKTSSVNDRVKLFDTQNEVLDSSDDRAREEKAAAIRREILELKSQTKDDDSKSNGSDVEIQSPIESKVKPLKIPMKPKMVDGGGGPKQSQHRGVPGATLRINQPAGIQTSPQPPEVKSILRSSRSSERNLMPGANHITSSSTERRNSLENITSVKSRIESYLNAAEEDQQLLQQQQQQQQLGNNMPGLQMSASGMGQQLKSILVKSEKSKKKSPKLVHNVNNLQIFTQSATDHSEDDEDLLHRNRKLDSHLLQIPEHPGD